MTKKTSQQLIKELQEKLARQEEENKRLAAKVKELEIKNSQLMTVNSLKDQTETHLWSIIAAFAQEVKERSGFEIVEDEQAVYELIKRGLETLRTVPHLQELIAEYSKRIRSLTSSSSERTQQCQARKEKPETTKLKEKVLKLARQIKSKERKLDMINEALAKIAKGANADSGSLEQAAKSIIEQATQSEAREVDPIKSILHGRGAVPQLRDPDQQIGPSQPMGNYACPNCESSTDWIQMAEMRGYMRSLYESLGNLVQNTSYNYPIMGCKCGQVHLHTGNADVPVTPKRSVSQGFILESAYLMTCGIPLERTYQILDGKTFQIGSSTLQENLNAFYYEAGGKALVDGIEEIAKTATTAIADGTPLRILQQEGCSQKQTLLNGEGQFEKIDRDDEQAKAAILKAEGKELPKQPYVEVITSVPAAEKPFVLYKRLLSRSGASINSVMGSYSALTKLITDAYAGYGKLDNIKTHQSCLVHFLREVLVVIPVDDYAQMSASKSGFEQLKTKFKQMAPDLQLCLCAKALRLVFDNERTLDALDNSDPAARLEKVKKSRQEKSRPLMDYIDQFMQNLAPTAAVRVGTKWKASSSADAWAAPVVYYLNQRDNLRAFLDDPELVIDSNTAERAIRPFTVLRAACNFRQSIEETDVLLGYFTLFETARAAGIKNPIKWLKDFGRAYFEHQADAALTERRRVGLDLSREFCFPATPAPGFDMENWMPWTYAKDPERNF